MDITASAPATWTGTVDLTGDALLEFTGTTGITAIGTSADITLNGPAPRVALSSNLATNSALASLATNGGTFVLENGASLATTVGLTNNGTIEVDVSGNGGSKLTIGGTLTNNEFLEIGNSIITTATAVTVAALSNSSEVEVTSGTAATTLKVTGGLTNSETVSIEKLFGSGGSIVTIGGTLTNKWLGLRCQQQQPQQGDDGDRSGSRQHRNDKPDRRQIGPSRARHHVGGAADVERNRRSHG